MGVEKQFMVECEEILPKLAEQAGAIRENYMRLGEYVRSDDYNADKKACDLAVNHFSGSLSSSEARSLMRKFLEEV